MGNLRFEHPESWNQSISLSPEKPLQYLATLNFSHAASDFALVIQRWHLEQIDHAAGPAGLRIRAAVDDAAKPGLHDRSCAHRAWFLGDIEIAVVQSPVVHDTFGLRDCQYLCVCRGIFQDFHLVPCAGDDLCVPDNHGADRNFILRFGFLRLSQSFAHEIGIARKIQQIVHDKG
jgi:hypothetical protein